MATLSSSSEREMDCSREIVIWNYFDHEHVVGTHYKYYSRFKILAEQNEWCLIERFYRLPIIGWKTSSTGFMALEHPGLIRSIQFGKFGLRLDQRIHMKELGPDRCLVKSEYTLEVPFFVKPFEFLFRRITQKWFDQTWDEDAPMRLRRQRVWKLGFRNFAGIDYVNARTEKPAGLPAERPYPIELPVPKTRNPRNDREYARPFASSVEVGYAE